MEQEGQSQLFQPCPKHEEAELGMGLLINALNVTHP